MLQRTMTLGCVLMMAGLVWSEIAYGVSQTFSLQSGGSKGEIREVGQEAGAIQISPNPFNPVVSISVVSPALKRSSVMATVSILNMDGRVVHVGSVAKSGFYRWNASAFPSGLYLVRVMAGTQTFSAKMTLMK